MNKVVLITGVSSGFGNSIARILIQNGHSVYGISRTIPDNLNLKQHFKADINQTAEIQEVIKSVLLKENTIDILINNAGMGLGGPLEEFSEQEAFDQMNTNFFATYKMCKAVLPSMRKQKQGLIINISSLGGLMSLPFQGFYSASKYAVEGFSEALRYELKQFNIKVILVNPGDFRTNFTKNRKVLGSMNEQSEYYTLFSKSLSIIEKDENSGLNPDKLAQKINSIILLKNPAPRYIIASFEQKLAVWLKYLLPERLFLWIIGSHYGV